jgi:chromosome partitioning protein
MLHQKGVAVIIVVAGTKGGTGKSTLATNLAGVSTLKGFDSILVDCDKQGTASSWSGTRDEAGLPHIPTIQKFGSQAVTQELRELQRKYKHVFVDSGGYDSSEMRASLLAGNRLLVPLRPSQPDIWGLPRMFEIIAQSKIYNPALSVLFVINGVSPNPFIKEVEDVMALAEDVEGMAFCQTVIHLRRAFVKAIGSGRMVAELDDDKATVEIESLFEEITND